MATPGGRHKHRRIVEHRVIPTPGTSLINAAQRVLSDGQERDAGQILAEAVKAGWLPPATGRSRSTPRSPSTCSAASRTAAVR